MSKVCWSRLTGLTNFANSYIGPTSILVVHDKCILVIVIFRIPLSPLVHFLIQLFF